MDSKAIVNNLCKLVQLDIDAAELYIQAINKIDIEAFKKSLAQFRNDHLRHIEDLTNQIRNLGGEAPKEVDFKGRLLEVLTAIRSTTGTEGVLKAMRMNEKLTNSLYEDAKNWDLPAPIHAIVEKNFADEQRHLSYIEKLLEAKPWDPSGVPHA